MSDKRREKCLEGQTALITGANTGIGKATAKAMAAAGAKVVVNYITNEEAANQVVQEIREANGRAIALRADISKEYQVTTMFKTMFGEYGTIDILVNNAGIEKGAWFHEMTLDQWDLVIRVNLTGSFLCSREAVKEFLRRDVVRERSCAAGKIIFISSVHDTIPWSGQANYCASKGGLMLLMKCMAQELAPLKVRVNSVSPGAIKTNINKSSWETPEAEAELLKLIPYKRVGEPEDVSSAVVWLASDEADYVTGATLYVDGGMTLYPGFHEGG